MRAHLLRCLTAKEVLEAASASSRRLTVIQSAGIESPQEDQATMLQLQSTAMMRSAQMLKTRKKTIYNLKQVATRVL